MLYTHYLISVDNRVPYRELGSNIQDESLTAFITDHFSHFSENDDFSKEQFAVYTTQKEMVIGCIHQLYLREKNRYFYLNHTYCADLSEREKILANLPNLIATTEFDSVPKQNPDLSLNSIPHREDDIITLTYPKEVLKQLVQASMDALLDNGKKHLFIIKKHIIFNVICFFHFIKLIRIYITSRYHGKLFPSCKMLCIGIASSACTYYCNGKTFFHIITSICHIIYTNFFIFKS